MQGVAVCRSDMIHLSFLGASKRFWVWVEKWDCRCEERWLAQSTGVWQFGKLGRSEVVAEGEPEMKRSREKTLLGRVLGERLEQVFCHDLALALEIKVEVYLEVTIWCWRSSSEQCAFANAFRCFATASATSEDHQVLAGRLMLPKPMEEVAVSLRSLVKVWVASERVLSVLKLEGVGQWVSI